MSGQGRYMRPQLLARFIYVTCDCDPDDGGNEHVVDMLNRERVRDTDVIYECSGCKRPLIVIGGRGRDYIIGGEARWKGRKG